jgi:hypothetical protein
LKLLIPKDAERTSSLVGRKCRASKVKVVEEMGNSGKKIFRSLYEESMCYEIGKTAKPDSYDGDIRIECTNGIHFFMTKEEAEGYLN